MRNDFTTPARAVLVALALMLADVADARAASAPPQPVATTTATPPAARGDEYPAERDEMPVGGILIIAGIVGGVILLAWICSRIGDSRITM